MWASGQYKSYWKIFGRFGCLLRRWQQRLAGLDGLIPALKFGWGDEVYARWLLRQLWWLPLKEEPSPDDALCRLWWRYVCVSARITMYLGMLLSIVIPCKLVIPCQLNNDNVVTWSSWTITLWCNMWISHWGNHGSFHVLCIWSSEETLKHLFLQCPLAISCSNIIAF